MSTTDAMDDGEGGSVDSGGVPGDANAGAPVLHRLTQVQINNSLRALFDAPNLAGVSLPPDFEVHGFSNNASVRTATPYLVESLQRDFQRVTGVLMAEPGAWLACSATGGDDPLGCGHTTLANVAPQIFRRPLAADETQWIEGLFDSWYADVGFDAAMQLSLQALLQSPDFLYLVEYGDTDRANGSVVPLTDWEIAARMSYFLWNSTPDAPLRELAAAGSLQDPAIVREQARRMIRDSRSRSAVLEFHRQWLDADEIENITIDPDTYFPNADDEEDPGGVIALFRVSLEHEFNRFIIDTVFGPGTLEAMLSSRQGWASDITSQFYGVSVDGVPGERVTGRFGGIDEYELTLYPVTFPADERAGFLTSGTFLASHAHPVYPSPVLRGVFIRERVLCQPTPVPPDDVPSLDEGQMEEPRTNRDRYSAHSSNPACSGCHQAIDGLGFPFEHYDSMGQFRMQDNGYPVDGSGGLFGTDVDGPVDGGIDVAERLAISRTAHDCAVTQWYRYAMHRDEAPEDEQAIAALAERFWSGGGEIPNLLVDIVSSQAFLTRSESVQ